MPKDPLITSFIEQKPAFAQPILAYLRELIQQECPQVEEGIKWRRVVFLIKGKIVCNMAAFTAHCGFGFWNPEIQKMLLDDGFKSSESSGSFGKITKIEDLPPKAELARYIREAVKLAENPAKTKSVKKTSPKPEIPMPTPFSQALERNEKAASYFRKLSPSHRREYLEWIVNAKRVETQEKRIATTLDWLGQGKPLNWKYEKC